MDECIGVFFPWSIDLSLSLFLSLCVYVCMRVLGYVIVTATIQLYESGNRLLLRTSYISRSERLTSGKINCYSRSTESTSFLRSERFRPAYA